MVGTYRYQHGDKPVDGYTVLRGIGRGGFGEVYYAVSDGGREVALKAIQQNTDIELRGVRHCINLKSPHLISIFDVKRNGDGASFVIMEYVAGVSLRDVIARDSQGMTADKAAYLLREIARGLTYLHDRGIVHRDLKPENIFYEDGYAKIGDYGLSKYISVSRQSGQTISVGTVHYMAPEIGSGNYSQGIDIYALGIIFFELLTGTVPFNGDSMGEILMKHLTQEPDVSRLEPRFQPIVRKALAKSPADRYASAREMVDAVFADEELAAAVARLDTPSFLSSIAPAAEATAATLLMAPPAVEARGADTAAHAPPPPRREAAAPVPLLPPPPPRARAAAGTGIPTPWREIRGNLVQGIAIAAASALALGWLGGRTKNAPAILGFFISFAATAAAILGVEHWFAPRFQIASGFVRRCVTFGLVGPVLAGLLAMCEGMGFLPGRTDRLFLALAAGLFAIDWHERCRRGRDEHVSVGLAVSAGLFGLVATPIVAGDWSPPFLFMSFGMLAAISLITNAVSPFTIKESRGGSRSMSLDAGGVLTTAGAADPRPAPAAVATPSPPPAPGLAPHSAPAPPPPRTKLIRPRSDVLVGGVCAAFARAYGWDTTVVRLIVCVLLFATFGATFLAYLACWIILPEEAPPPKLARPPRHPGLFRRVFLGICAVGLFAGSIAFAADSHLAGPEDLATCVAMNIAGAICLYFAVGSRRRASALPAPPRDEPRGWLTGLGAAGLIGGMALAAKASAGAAAWDRVTTESIGLLVWAPFILSTLCFAASRARRGVEHGVRGLFGWAGLSVLIVAGFVYGTEILDRRNHHFTDRVPFGPEEFLGFSALGLVSAVLLAWPARRRLPPPIPAPRPVEGSIA